VGYVGNKKVVPLALPGLKRLEDRGYNSAGIAVAGNGEGLKSRRAGGKLRNLEEAIRLRPLDRSYGIVRNGMVENYTVLEGKLECLPSRFEGSGLFGMVAKGSSGPPPILRAVKPIPQSTLGARMYPLPRSLVSGVAGFL